MHRYATAASRTLAALALAGGTAAAQTPSPSPAAGQIDFTNYMAIGDSLTAGTMNSSLVEGHQRNSVPALIARQAGVTTFEQPLVSEPGLPAELALISLRPGPAIGQKASAPGTPLNAGLSRPYNNLGVPGATSIDALQKGADDGATIVRYHDLILRGRGSQVQQTAGARPTFITLWIGNNDVLGAAVRGRAVDGVTLTPAPVFRTVYGQIINALKATGAKIIAANLPDVTAIAYVTSIPPFVVDPGTGQPLLVNGQRVPLIGPNGPLPANSLVTLAASTLLARGDGIPQSLGGRGTGLPDEAVLDPSEVAIIRERVAANNRAIAEICQAASVPVLDINGFLTEVAANGRPVGGVTLTGAFLTGGFFSLDGVHPTELGYAVVANEWIRVINENGGNLPPVDLSPFLGISTRESAASTGAPFVEFTAEAQQSLLDLFPLVNR